MIYHPPLPESHIAHFPHIACSSARPYRSTQPPHMVLRDIIYLYEVTFCVYEPMMGSWDKVGICFWHLRCLPSSTTRSKDPFMSTTPDAKGEAELVLIVELSSHVSGLVISILNLLLDLPILLQAFVVHLRGEQLPRIYV